MNACRRAAALITLAALVPAAAAAAPVAPTLATVSGVAGSPFAGCTDDLVDLQRSLGEIDFPNSEIEPFIAANPTNPDNLIAVWQQDRWSGGGSRGALAGVSFDGGDTWQVVTLTKGSACTGAPFWIRDTNPWVSFGPDGTAYFIHKGLFSPFIPLPETLDAEGVAVSVSHDGGLAWDNPIDLVVDTTPDVFHDKQTITADPYDGNYVYAVWHAIGDTPTGGLGQTIFTRSVDGGVSWEPIRSILDPGKHYFTTAAQILVRPVAVGGQLVNVFNLVHFKDNPSGQKGQVTAQVSGDRGETWSDPIAVASMRFVPTVDPNTGAAVRTGDPLLDAAVDPTSGDLYAVWHDSRFSAGAFNDVALSVSSDGGWSWSKPVPVPRDLNAVLADQNRQSFTPQVHVSSDGRLAVSYYDFRNNDGLDGDTETDFFVSQCADPDQTAADLCASAWVETRMTAASFDLREAPADERGLFLGGYTGLLDVPGAFGAAFSVSASGDPATTHYSTVPFGQ